MKDFIGLPLEQVEEVLKRENQTYKVVLNNFIVEGNRLLVTNAKSQDGVIVLTVGKFIFDLEGKQNETK